MPSSDAFAGFDRLAARAEIEIPGASVAGRISSLKASDDMKRTSYLQCVWSNALPISLFSAAAIRFNGNRFEIGWNPNTRAPGRIGWAFRRASVDSVGSGEDEIV
jgi:hypothetical protein